MVPERCHRQLVLQRRASIESAVVTICYCGMNLVQAELMSSVLPMGGEEWRRALLFY